jgi:hypothetical protein
MPNSQIASRAALTVTVALCIIASVLMLLLDVQSLVVDLVYQGF